MYPTDTPDIGGSSTPSPNRRGRHSEVSWTDDLPQCQLSDLAFAPNVVYLADGRTTEAYPYEDKAFNLATDYDCYLYGVFDGYDGVKAAHFASERLPAELLLGQLTPHVNETSTKSILRQTFSVVERGFFESIDNYLAKKTHLQSQIPDNISSKELDLKFPILAQQLRQLNDDIKGGTTAVVALVINNNLYVANVGDSRALLCQRRDHNGPLEVKQITVNHDINNQNELERLSQLGLNVKKILERGKLGINECTRGIGDYSMKGGYKENDILRDATSEPVIATPDIYGPIPLSGIQSGFLVLMSDDVYKSLEQATGITNANYQIANMISHQLLCRNRMEGHHNEETIRISKTHALDYETRALRTKRLLPPLTTNAGVAQSVLDKIAYLHKRGFGKSHTFSRGDMTLVVRNISHSLGVDALTDIDPGLPDLSGRHPVSVPYEKRKSMEVHAEYGLGYSGKPSVTLSLVMPNSESQNDHGHRGDRRTREDTPPSEDTPTNAVIENNDEETYCSSSTEHFSEDLFYKPDPHEQLQLDDDNKVASYVSFVNFDEEAWLKLRAKRNKKA